ncbi:class I adenylate-forming enzyme family protein [Meiothermus hypogaeus]|uniref:Long-chain-fatty-acid--CoA ligase n=2 Tax=Meiothermus hypogaeus TaxID=884155 RepID=A0ABX9MM64_9DEIN|nr:AMP-binding protein [Meiothermus hypogaeus]RIH77902.1 Long-chain-fatty-acid--CoA ligase [Meiothermus hypogaeus]GEM82621.1 putative fatty-acid-CoA ligase FadD [Meiothermus hypogaeus NBRC 106114]
MASIVSPSGLAQFLRLVAKSGLLGSKPLVSLASLVPLWLRFGGSLYTLAAWAAARFPNRLAVVEGEQQLSFQQLLEHANRLAAALQERFAMDSVGILGRNRIAYIVALLACTRLGCDLVLLNPMFGPEQLRVVLRRRPLGLLLFDLGFRPLVEEALASMPATGQPRLLALEDTPELIAESPIGKTHHKPRKSSLTVLTSGTTGPAKEVRRSIKAAEALGLISNLLLHLQPHSGQRVLLAVPLLHGHGLATLALCLVAGLSLHLGKSRARDLWEEIQAHKIELLVLVPTILHRLLEAGAPSHGNHLRAVISGSAPLNPSLVLRTLAMLGQKLYNLYGSSETGVISLASPKDLLEAPGTVGHPLPGVTLKILDEAKNELPRGQIGQVWVSRGGQIAPTGDLGYLDPQGRLFLTGRADEVLICGGEKVFPTQIEERITNLLPYAEECAVVGVPDLEYGQALHLFLVLKPGHDSMETYTIQRDLEAHLPRTLRPRHITLLTELPRNQAGKLLRAKLHALLEAKPH